MQFHILVKLLFSSNEYGLVIYPKEMQKKAPPCPHSRMEWFTNIITQNENKIVQSFYEKLGYNREVGYVKLVEKKIEK